MKYSPIHYARAFVDLKPDTKRFLSVMEKNGDFGKIDKILLAIEELSTKEDGGRVIDIEFARDIDSETVEKLKKKFNNKDRVKFRLNPSLIAGVRVTVDGIRELDMSFRRKVNQLFVSKN